MRPGGGVREAVREREKLRGCARACRFEQQSDGARDQRLLGGLVVRGDCPLHANTVIQRQ